MNYYERHLGDYAKDTAHLSMIEHGAYNMLLDRYYSTESGIPEAQAHRLARARSKEEKRAVDDVLVEFFVLIDGLWINRRTEDEIVKARTRIGNAKENGKKGGRPKKAIKEAETETQEKPSGLFAGYENETRSKAHQTPDTRHHTKSTSTDTNLTTVTPAGIVCGRLKAEARITDASPQHPKLLALLAAGMSENELVDAGREAGSKGKGFAYALAVAEGRRRDAANVAALPTAKAKQTNGRQAAIDNYTAQAAEARGEGYERTFATERDITGEACRVA